MQRSVHLTKKKLSLLINSSHSWTDIQLHQRASSSAVKLDEARQGWLMRRGADGDWRRMCWLPYKRRNGGVVRACFGQKVVIAAHDGLMTILDFSDI
jgi:hypothetical protein